MVEKFTSQRIHFMEYISLSGREKLKQELRELKTVKRHEIAKRLEQAKTLGDLSENAEYQEAKEEQSLVESQIIELEDRLRNAVIIEGKPRTDQVTIGSTVRLKSDRGEEIYTIVGSGEADPAEGKISNESPLGKAFLGRRAGDMVEVKTPSGVIIYKIIRIE